MRSHDDDKRFDLTIVTRRSLLKVGGIASIVGLAGLSGMLRVSDGVYAQEATPTATGAEIEGSYAVVRSRQIKAGHIAADVMASIEAGYVPLLREVPGFVAYIGVADPASTASAFITICADKAGTDESTRLAGQWLTDNGYDYFEGDPVVLEGPIGIAAGNLPTVTTTAATPTGTDGAAPYLVIRSRRIKADSSPDDLLNLIRTGFVPIVTTVPGFTAYLASVNAETRDQFAITIGEDQAAVEESTKRAAEWGQQGASAMVEGDPVVLQGVIAIAVQAAATS
jgi:hypothetical protein